MPAGALLVHASTGVEALGPSAAADCACPRKEAKNLPSFPGLHVRDNEGGASDPAGLGAEPAKGDGGRALRTICSFRADHREASDRSGESSVGKRWPTKRRQKAIMTAVPMAACRRWSASDLLEEDMPLSAFGGSRRLEGQERRARLGEGGGPYRPIDTSLRACPDGEEEELRGGSAHVAGGDGLLLHAAQGDPSESRKVRADPHMKSPASSHERGRHFAPRGEVRD